MYRIYKITNPNLPYTYVGMTTSKYICRTIGKYKYDFKNNKYTTPILKKMFENDIERTKAYLVTEVDTLEEANEILQNYSRLYPEPDLEELKIGYSKSQFEYKDRKEWQKKYYLQNKEKKLNYQKEWFKNNFIRINGSETEQINKPDKK